MDYKESARGLCRDYFRAFASLDDISARLSAIIRERVVAAMHHDGLVSDVREEDLRVSFRHDGSSVGSFDNTRVYVFFPERDCGGDLSVSGKALAALQESLCLAPGKIWVSMPPRWSRDCHLCVWWFLDSMCSGLGFDWEEEAGRLADESVK